MFGCEWNKSSTTFKYEREQWIEFNRKRIDHAIEWSVWLRAEIWSIECDSMFFFKKKNVILSAKTNYEKNMILYFAFVLNTDSVFLIIYSLNVLKIDQIKIISNLNVDVSFCVLNENILTNELLFQIQFDQYIHVLTNFEFAIKNDSFKKIMQFFDFRNKLVLMMINETHLIKNWVEWRSEYDRLNELKSILFRFVSIFAISATFTDDLIKKFVNNLKLNDDVKIIKKSIDRENIFYNVQVIHSEFEDFRFLIFSADAIVKKMIIYENSIAVFKKMMKSLIDFYTTNEATFNQAHVVIKCYNEKMFESEKKNMRWFFQFKFVY